MIVVRVTACRIAAPYLLGILVQMRKFKIKRKRIERHFVSNHTWTGGIWRVEARRSKTPEAWKVKADVLKKNLLKVLEV